MEVPLKLIEGAIALGTNLLHELQIPGKALRATK
jgi:hypothetical protein